MRHLSRILFATLALNVSVALADTPATAPATQPAKPPALLSKLSAMPQSIWVTQDASSPSKWQHEPERLRWCMTQFPWKVKTYGEDTFTGTAKILGRPRHKDPKLPDPYMTDLITDEYTVCGIKVKIIVTVYTSSPPPWGDGETVTVTGPTQFWDFDGFTHRENDMSQTRRFLRVVVHPELNTPFGYPAPIILKRMGLSP